MRMSPLEPIDKASYYGAPSIQWGGKKKMVAHIAAEADIGGYVGFRCTKAMLKVFFIGLEMKVMVINAGDNNLKQEVRGFSVDIVSNAVIVDIV